MITNQVEGYPTQDTALAAYLVHEGFKIVDIDYNRDPKRATFIFHNDNPDIYDFAHNFNAAKSKSEPQGVIRLYKRLSYIARNKLEFYEGIV